MSRVPELLDHNDSVCAMSKTCTPMVGAGGFDQHHPIPLEFGGPDKQVYLNLCPSHHRRQHALTRYYYNRQVAGLAPEGAVIRHFNAQERKYARAAITWLADHNGGALPAIHSWPAPAARAR